MDEIALLQRAYRYFDKVHAFARDYILERGTEATDFEVGQALSVYGVNLMMKDVQRDGRPHSAVGIEVTSEYVRAGVATAYPHPNQFFHARIRRGEPLYVNCDILLGGYGGECYRNYVIAPWDPPRYQHNETGEDNAAAHLRSLTVGHEVIVPITAAKLDLGPWQRVFYGEWDGQRRKRVVIKVLGDQ